MIGTRFGKLVVQARAEGACRWLCLCDCGKTKSIRADHLKSGATTSCGCVLFRQGGLARTREYGIWSKMLLRCYRTDNENYRFYGGLGTYVCDRWRESCAAFIEDMGKAPSLRHSLDRIDTNGSYTCGKCDECREKGQPANCRWATKEVQSRNQKNNRYYTHDGKTLILKDWARLSGIKYITLWQQLASGMPFADAITVGRYDRTAITKAKAKGPSRTAAAPVAEPHTLQ